MERIIEELGLRNLFSSYKGFTKLKYDVYGFAKLLIIGRLLNPASKIATVRQNDDYYESVLTDFNSDNVYDTLDFIAEHKDKIIRRMNTNLVKKAHRRPEIIYYDVTNFYFEIGKPDDDELDENGDVYEKGLRKMGVCKEERKLPIVQMGLFMDDNGIPIAVESFPGNTLDHLTLRDALKRNVDGIDFSRFILIGDRGICMYLIDMDKVKRFKEDMGYYQIVTSELTMPPKEVIDKYHGLSRIEDQFRVMKGDLGARPIFVKNKEHIEAHLLICMIALIIMRIIQNRIVESGIVPTAKEKEVNWTAGLSAERVQGALNKWQVEKMPGDYYRFLGISDPDLKLILNAFNIEIPYKMFQRGELKSFKTKTEIFM